MFDQSKVKGQNGMHLNGGRAFNKFQGDLIYEGVVIGQFVKGREGKENINIVFIDDQEFNMYSQREDAIAAMKAKVEAMQKKG